MPEAKKLIKAAVPESLIPHPSPVNLQSTRLAVHANGVSSSCWVFLASGSCVHKLHISLEDLLDARGKESLLIPKPAKVLESSSLSHAPHRSEIQSITLAGTEDTCILGSVDTYGQLVVSKLNESFGDVEGVTYSVSPVDAGIGEGSWAGLSFKPSQLLVAAVARSLCWSIDIYNQDIHLCTLHTLWNPNSITFLDQPIHGQSSLLAVAEGSQMHLFGSSTINYHFDSCHTIAVKHMGHRNEGNGGCVQGVSVSIGNMLYSVSVSSSGYIAVGGADRSVTVYDPRRWSVVSRCVNCSKYEITGLAFSSVNPNYIYVQGVDYEVLSGDWKESKKAFSFRGDSNSLGFSKCSSRDLFAGWCDSGNVFVADVS